MKKNIATWCPVFCGFYNSPYLNESTEEQELYDFRNNHEDYSIKKEDVENIIEKMVFNSKLYDETFSNYQKKIVNKHCENVVKFLKDEDGIIIKISNISVVSPKFYNYSTDSINCDIELDIKELLKLLKDNKEWTKYCKDNYTSRPGFISHYKPEDIENATTEQIEKDNHILGAMLEFLLNDVQCDIEQETLEDVSMFFDWGGIANEISEKA